MVINPVRSPWFVPKFPPETKLTQPVELSQWVQAESGSENILEWGAVPKKPESGRPYGQSLCYFNLQQSDDS